MFKSPSVPRPPYPFPSEVGCLRPSRPPPRGICGLSMRLFLDFGNSPSSLVTSARGSVVQVLSPHRTPRYLILGHLQRSRAERDHVFIGNQREQLQKTQPMPTSRDRAR